MIRRSILQLVSAVVLVVAGAGTPALAADARLTADGRIPVVFHVTNKDPLMWNQSLNNAANYQRAMGKDKVMIEIVVNGPAIKMLLADSEVEPRVTAALTDGVKIVACEQTMKGAKLTKNDMIPGIGYVPGGIVEVIDRQREGWAYVNY
jgi:intracellular sulfur oxidation DsrE/DsrF family protein